ncbi:hypothetical protein G5I_06072 [Acromyrmex echinatior]|uniref:Uncharacterized protein n=1 Tax=Acromyrmex echinatior TaxID=103372 RepID=F4WK29_ACREC|nr:hypothetical protein G5I_06072 [Acromyrmex echinatior]
MQAPDPLFLWRIHFWYFHAPRRGIILWKSKEGEEVPRKAATEDIDNEDVENAAELRYSAIINPLRGGHVTYGHYDETEKPLQSYDWYSEIRRGVSPGRESVVRPNKNRPVLAVYIYQDQRFKGQDEFLGGNVAGGLIGVAWRFASLPYSGPSRLPPVGWTPGTVVPFARNAPVISTGYRLERSRGAQLTMKYVHRKSGVLYQRGGG